MSPLLSLCTLLVLSIGANSAPRAITHDLVDMDNNGILDLDHQHLNLNTEQHQLFTQLIEHALPEVPLYTMTSEGKISPYSLETPLKVRYFKEKDSHGSLVVIEDEDGTRRVRGSFADEHGDILIRPADSAVRAQREAGNWHMVYRADGEEGTKPSDVMRPPKDEYDAWLAAQQKKLKPTMRTGAIDKWTEVMVFVDYDAYVKHQNLLGTTNRDKVLREMNVYYSQMMGQVADIYRVSFRNEADMRVNIRTAGIVISTDPGTSPWIEAADVQIPALPVNSEGEKTYDGSKGLSNFNTWINANTQGMTYDQAVSITGRDMRLPSGEDFARGIAYLGQVCGYLRGVVVEEEGTFGPTRTVAHELGHNLGANHDGDANPPEAAACAKDGNYVLNNGNSGINPKNRYYFSSCSKVQMKKTLATASCVNNAATDEPFTAGINSNYLPGQWISYADRCKLTFGTNALPMSYDRFESSNIDVCSDFWCMYQWPSTSASGETGIIAPLGTPCGDGKMCVESNCVADARAPKGSCYLGDTAIYMADSTGATKAYRCAEAVPILIQKYGYASQQAICDGSAAFKKSCCRTCGVAGGVDPAVKDGLLNSQATTASTTTTTASTTTKASTTATTTTTTRPPTTTTTRPPTSTPATTTTTTAATTTTTTKPPTTTKVTTTTTRSPTTTAATTTTTTTTTQPPTTTTPCIDDIRVGKACLVYKTSCALDKVVTANGINIGYVRDVCKKTCAFC